MDDETPQKRGGLNRAANLSPDERREIAKKGAEARWSRGSKSNSSLPTTIKWGEREVGGYTIPVFNLSTGDRVLSERGFLYVIGAKGRGSTGGHRIAAILKESIISSLFSKELLMAIENPIRFLNESNKETFGYRSHVLKDFCIGFSKAKNAGALKTEVQFRYASNCETLLYAFAQAGIDAWIDEATGYQADRARDAIDQIIKKYIAPSYFEWVKTFPDEFFEQIYKLKKWRYDPNKAARPGHVAHLITDIVYARLAPGVLDELQKRNPVIESTKRRKKKHHQWLTRDHGHPKLKEHISNITFMMRGASSWDGFYRNLQRAAPKQNETPEFNFGDD